MIKLTAAVVKDYVKQAARLKKRTAELESLKADIKEAMDAAGIEVYDPVASPYMLILRTSDRSDVDYKEMARSAYKRLYGDDWRERWVNAKDRFGSSEVKSLYNEPNPRYKEDTE